ncbi:anti-sigma factor [Dactylosporangium aurantiacum]|uniref:Regulator of SigK n=1 Tax=Dactylosporangium aurantiacum TaxID=35754 RepID=A0A9Q9IIQ1_9ACTN|nr:anti-sigma factor [Dactylosporangium aurantiacum]MDG6101071.1 anti-sigma factor [Dactylosporangium aurantiacum]UWZ54890.1 anti-sigma factor [Dactylosporangium aurantiacum]
MAETVDIHALAGAYALDAVDDVERAAFDRHLRDCEACAVEVAELRETASWLTHAVASPPPPRLREAVLAEIGRTAQERPRRSAPGAGRSRRSRLVRWAVAGVAAAVLAAGVGVGTWTVAQQGVRQENARIDGVLAAPDARLVSAEMGGGRVTLVVSPSRDAAVAVLDGLDDPGADKDYQLWMLDSAGPRSVGVVAGGTGRRYIEGLASGFAVTKEPAGGSDRPTEPLVGQIRL